MVNIFTHIFLRKALFFFRGWFFFWIIFSLFSSRVFAQIKASQDFSVVTYRVGGHQQRSFYPEAQTRYLYEGTFDIDKKIPEKQATFYGRVFYRSTDDPLTDLKDFSIEQAVVGYRHEKIDVVMGDDMVFFSDYSFNNAFKGARLLWKGQDSLTLTVLAGIDAPQWESLWQTKKDGSGTRRYVWATRLESSWMQKALTVGLSYAGALDDHNSFAATETTKDIRSGSMDLLYRITKELSLKAEAARSYRKMFVNRSIINAPKQDQAYKIRLELTKSLYSSVWEYRYVGSHFETTGGFAEQDLETVQLNNTIFLTRSLTLSPYISFNRNNLSKLKEQTTKQIYSGFNASWTLTPRLTLTGGWDLRKEYTSSKSSSNRTHALRMGMTQNFTNWSIKFQYSLDYIRDHVNPDQERNNHALLLNIEGSLPVGKNRVFWNMGQQLTLNKDIATDKRDLFLSPSAGLRFNLPGGFNIQTNVSFTDNDFYVNENDTTVYRYHFSASKNVKDGLSASLEYTQNDHDFTGQDNDYFEKKILVKIACQF